MRKFIIAAAAAATLASPALAQDAASPFAGPRVGINIGTGGDDPFDFDGTTIGVDVGYDWDMGGAVAGLGIEYQTDLGDGFFDANETAIMARVGGKIGQSALIYVNGGYSRVALGSTPFGSPGGDGIRVGVGGEFALGGGGTSLKIEQRYGNYGNGAEVHQTVAGINFRF